MSTYRWPEFDDSSTSKYFNRISDSDLRRALLFYLVGLQVSMLHVVIDIGDFVSGFIEGSETVVTSRWIKRLILIISVTVVLLSQLWYLRTRYVLEETERSDTLPKGLFIVEMPALLWITYLWIDFFRRYIKYHPEPLPSFSITAVLILIYSPIILSWNYKRIIDKKYPEIREYSFAASVGLGMVSSVVIIFLQFIVTSYIETHVTRFISG